ncbi:MULTISPECIES: DUF4405 domain-containing protein [unclassified Ensifer]|uniref:DUF4405 domain-containing protein n=1 Tax=unclassified Ensifer TaxID=2633371 RepID=UPI0030100C2B
MTPVFLLRLGLDFLAVGLFVVAMAYWWMDNRSHELIGTGMFALLLLHNVFNRRWYGGVARTPRQARPLVTIGLNLTLLVTMVTLLTTSILISQSLFGFLAVGGRSARDAHILAAYWALIIVSIHLGLHWSIVMNVVRSLLGIRRNHRGRTTLLRLAACGIATCGVYSSFELDVGSRLLLVPTMQFWDFNEGAAGFFLRVASITGLYVAAGHYGITAIQASRRRPAEVSALGEDRAKSIS